MRINYNVSSIMAKNALNNNDKRVAASTRKLSSGCKISSASDNASGLAIARRMNAQIKSLEQANQNANDGLSVVNTADGAMTEMHDILQRMNELAIQSANGTNSDSDREMIQNEIDQLVNEIDRIAQTTQFNSQTLLDGSFAYKAYTNCENAKVMSHSESVATGTYVIGQLTYYHYEDKVTTYVGELNKKTGEKIVSDIETKERYSADNDGVKLVTTASIADYKDSVDQFKTFPDSSRIVVEDENITVKADNGFEMKLTLNNRTPVTNTTSSIYSGVIKDDVYESKKTTYEKDITGVTTVTTTSFSSTTTYKNIAVESADGKWCSIKELNFYTETYSDGSVIDENKKEIYAKYEGDNGSALDNDLKGLFEQMFPDSKVSVKGIEHHEKEVPKDEAEKLDPPLTPPATTSLPEGFYVTVEVFDRTRKEVDASDDKFDPANNPYSAKIHLNLYQKKNEYGVVEDPKTLKNYMVSKTQTTKTKYEVGKANDPDDCLTIDVTGMGAMVIQVGANEGQNLKIEIPALNAVNLGVDGLDVSTEDSATAAIDIVGKAINQLSAVRAKIGAYSNRLEHTITNLDTAEENITSAYSRIMDVDMAEEMTEYSTVQVLVQASTSMLAQANERPQQVLQLLQ